MLCAPLLVFLPDAVLNDQNAVAVQAVDNGLRDSGTRAQEIYPGNIERHFAKRFPRILLQGFRIYFLTCSGCGLFPVRFYYYIFQFLSMMFGIKILNGVAAYSHF